MSNTYNFLHVNHTSVKWLKRENESYTVKNAYKIKRILREKIRDLEAN